MMMIRKMKKSIQKLLQQPFKCDGPDCTYATTSISEAWRHAHYSGHPMTQRQGKDKYVTVRRAERAKPPGRYEEL